jgi:hypothetical protein
LRDSITHKEIFFRGSFVKDRLGDQRGGSEWVARSDPQNHTLRTSTFRLPKPHSHWSATSLRNKHYQQPQHTHPRQRKQPESQLSRGGPLDRVWGAVRPPPRGNQEILRNTSSEHQNTPWFHHQRSLVRTMLATRKS